MPPKEPLFGVNHPKPITNGCFSATSCDKIKPSISKNWQKASTSCLTVSFLEDFHFAPT